MPYAGAEPIISSFGLDGDGLDRVNRFSFQRNLNIHCGSTRQNVTIDWFTSSGTKVGINDRNLRVGRYSNGSAVLQIATTRRLNICDGGVYTCVANDLSTQTEQRKRFILIIGCKFTNLVSLSFVYIYFYDTQRHLQDPFAFFSLL